jgi:bifunctional non-homologous end joining protein LigD
VALPSVTPIAPVRVRQPFDHPQWVFEPKLDGFRAIAYIEHGVCRLVSRRGHVYKAFAPLAAALATELRGRTAILDGELVCVGADGQPQFYALMFRRAQPLFYAFDVLSLDGEDLRELPLLERKRRLRRLVPRRGSRLLYVEHVGRRGRDLFRVICERDLEGIVGKLAHAPYITQPSPWVKVLNPWYTQKQNRHDVFDRRLQNRAVKPKSVTDGKRRAETRRLTHHRSVTDDQNG